MGNGCRFECACDDAIWSRLACLPFGTQGRQTRVAADVSSIPMATGVRELPLDGDDPRAREPEAVLPAGYSTMSDPNPVAARLKIIWYKCFDREGAGGVRLYLRDQRRVRSTVFRLDDDPHLQVWTEASARDLEG